MSKITIPSNYRIGIPKVIREELSLKPGQKIQAIVVGDKIELVPNNDLSDAKGFLVGSNIGVDREPDRL